MFKHFGCKARLLSKHFGCKARFLFNQFGCKATLLFKHLVQSKTFIFLVYPCTVHHSKQCAIYIIVYIIIIIQPCLDLLCKWCPMLNTGTYTHMPQGNFPLYTTQRHWLRSSLQPVWQHAQNAENRKKWPKICVLTLFWNCMFTLKHVCVEVWNWKCCFKLHFSSIGQI